MTSRSPAQLGLVTLAALLLAGCGTPAVGGQGAPAAAGGTAGTAAGAGPVIDACSFFSAAEVEDLIGSAPAGSAQSTPAGGSGCTWEDPDNYHSLTVDIGDPDTAINGTLPPWEAALGPERTLPGGMRDVNGSVEFVCGGTRYCSVQVVNEIQGDADQQAGVGLVEKIRARVGG